MPVMFGNRKFRPEDLDGRRFQDVSSPDAPIATYRVQGNRLSGQFQSESVPVGYVGGHVTDDGKVNFAYLSVNDAGEITVGVCSSEIVIDDDGRIRLEETFLRYLPQRLRGTSTLLEVVDEG